MSPTTLKIKTKMLERGDTFEKLRLRWGFSRALLTKVAHGERHNVKAQQRLARYVGVPVIELFPERNGRQQASKAA